LSLVPPRLVVQGKSCVIARSAAFCGIISLCLAPCRARDEGRRRTSGSREGSIQPVREQSGGARPSESEATNPPDAGFKRFDNAVVTISGIELAEKIKKRQFKTGKLGGRNATMKELWNATLAALARMSSCKFHT
jgi:hypothetical protein